MTEQVELLDFYADWCGQCQMMKPVVEELEKEVGDKVKITKINVDENQELASQYDVMSLPSFVIKKNGRAIEQFNGEQTKETLLEKLK